MSRAVWAGFAPAGARAIRSSDVGEEVKIAGEVRADRGSVAAGRDVVARLLVTGDRNTFFFGGYQRLDEAYIDPWSAFERVRLDRFTGREWLETEVDRFLNENDRGYFVLEAKAGVGKSAFLAHLITERAWIQHFVELAPGEAGVVTARKNLAAQLMRAYDLAAEREEPVLPDEAASRPDFLWNLLRQASEKRKDDEKIVLVVDGLDEAGTRPGENVLGLPRVLPAGVFFLVSKRPVPVALDVEPPRRVVTLDPESKENLTDVRAYLEGAVRWAGIACALRESSKPREGPTVLRNSSRRCLRKATVFGSISTTSSRRSRTLTALTTALTLRSTSMLSRRACGRITSASGAGGRRNTARSGTASTCRSLRPSLPYVRRSRSIFSARFPPWTSCLNCRTAGAPFSPSSAGANAATAFTTRRWRIFSMVRWSTTASRRTSGTSPTNSRARRGRRTLGSRNVICPPGAAWTRTCRGSATSSPATSTAATVSATSRSTWREDANRVISIAY
jgi:hypothetical protein